MPTQPPGPPPVPPDCPPDCAECAADDGGWAELEAEADQVLARHDAHCIAEAMRDANPCGHNDGTPDRVGAAHMLADGDSPCRCGRLADQPAG